MNIRDVWDLVKRNQQNPFLTEIRVGFIDSDFSNRSGHQDLRSNLSPNSPYISSIGNFYIHQLNVKNLDQLGGLKKDYVDDPAL